MSEQEIETLTALSRSRTEPASRVSRAAMLLAYRDNPSFFAVGRRLGVHHQTVQRCVERAESYGPLSALDDRPRPGKEPVITPEAKAWLVSLACDKAKDHGYPHELWTTRLLARHAREHGPGAGHPCLARLVQGTVSKLLGQEEIKPHKMRYYLERRDAEFEQKMAEVLCVYREVQVLKKAAARSNKSAKRIAIVSYDEKPGIQAIATTAPDLPPVPGVHPAFARDFEYKRHGTLSLLAGIDLLTGKVHALVKDRHRSRECPDRSCHSVDPGRKPASRRKSRQSHRGRARFCPRHTADLPRPCESRRTDHGSLHGPRRSVAMARRFHAPLRDAANPRSASLW
jgi:transposase